MNLNHSLTPINSMTCKCPQSNYFTFEQGLPINGSDQPQHHGQPLHWFDMHYVMTSNASKFSLPHQSWWLKITTQCNQPYHTVRTISLMTISTCNHSTSSLAIGTHLQPYMRPCNHCGHTQWYAPGSPRHQNAVQTFLPVSLPSDRITVTPIQPLPVPPPIADVMTEATAPTTTVQTEGNTTLATVPHTHITITMYNVVSARGMCLIEALRFMQALNTDIAILTKAKLTQNKHAHHSHEYNVFASLAPSSQQGSVAIAWRAES